MTYVALPVTAIIVPLLLWMHSRHVDGISKEEGGNDKLSLFTRIVSVWSVAALLAVVALVWLVEYQKPPAPATPELSVFPIVDYDEETVAYLNNQALDDDDRDELVRIFRHAHHLLENGDLMGAENTLLSLNNGSDQTGTFAKLDSYVVDNNLGVVSFQIRRNKHFQASRYLQAASTRKYVTVTSAKMIADNLETLDEAVNRLD